MVEISLDNPDEEQISVFNWSLIFFSLKKKNYAESKIFLVRNMYLNIREIIIVYHGMKEI